MIALVLAAGLQLQLVPETQMTPPMAPPSSQPGFITFNPNIHHEIEVEDPDHPKPLRSTAWIMAGGYGLAGIGAGIGSIMAEAFSRTSRRSGDVRDTHAGNTGMAIGALVGLVPGLIFGNEARKENNAIARSVLVVTDIGGTLAIGFGWAQSHSRLTF